MALTCSRAIGASGCAPTGRRRRGTPGSDRGSGSASPSISPGDGGSGGIRTSRCARFTKRSRPAVDRGCVALVQWLSRRKRLAPSEGPLRWGTSPEGATCRPFEPRTAGTDASGGCPGRSLKTEEREPKASAGSTGSVSARPVLAVKAISPVGGASSEDHSPCQSERVTPAGSSIFGRSFGADRGSRWRV